MRIIRGSLKKKKINPPKTFKGRPTTDQAKEGLFNILEGRFEIPEIEVLDLFSGTGNISYEFASRGCRKITLVEKNHSNYRFILKTVAELGLKEIRTLKADVFSILPKLYQHSYDIIFADPPYDLAELIEIPEKVFQNHLLKRDGRLIVEHPAEVKFSGFPGFLETRKYGHVHFSFFSESNAL